MGKEMNNKRHNNHCFFGMILIMVFILPYATNAQISAPGSVVEVKEDRSNISSDICPEPKAALFNSPDDLSKIQEEITRLNLCVQRAQLLERLNSLVIKNIQTIDSAIEANFSLNMPEITIPPITAFEVNGGMDTDNNAPSFSLSSEVVRNVTTWKIKDIKGGKNGMEAVLVDDSGNAVRLSVGDKLPDGSKGVVSSIGVTGVEVKINNKIQRLQWMN
jgi:hypothetical protein